MPKQTLSVVSYGRDSTPLRASFGPCKHNQTAISPVVRHSKQRPHLLSTEARVCRIGSSHSRTAASGMFPTPQMTSYQFYTPTRKVYRQKTYVSTQPTPQHPIIPCHHSQLRSSRLLAPPLTLSRNYSEPRHLLEHLSR